MTQKAHFCKSRAPLAVAFENAPRFLKNARDFSSNCEPEA
jgi:hypothetical protein